MPAFPRAMVIVGLLAASTMAAQARDDGSRYAPVPPERPLLLDASVTSSTHVEASGELAKASHHRGVRSADGRHAASAPNTEAAAPSPADDEASHANGPQETGAPTVADLVTRHARDNGVPLGLAEAVVRIESRGNPRASHRGALGLMQIKPATARAVGFSGGASALLVADTNLRYGMKVLGEAFRSSGGDVCRALMLYQSGHLATRMTRSNRAYCSRARAFMAGA